MTPSTINSQRFIASTLFHDWLFTASASVIPFHSPLVSNMEPTIILSKEQGEWISLKFGLHLL